MEIVQQNIMPDQNQMVIFQYERIQFYIHAHQIHVEFIRIIQMYRKQNALMVKLKRMLLLATKQCMI